MKKTITIILFALLYISIIKAQTTITLQPGATIGKDALLHGLDVNVNYGSNDQFAGNAWTVGGSPSVIRSIIEFDLTSIPSNATITSAELSLYARDNTSGLGQHSTLSGPNDCWLERVSSSWDESTVTWNTQPTTTTLNRVNIPASTSATQDYPNINVALLVQDMLNNPSSSFGFMIKLQDENYYRNLNFCSSDHLNSALNPKLVITYTQASPCITLQPDASGGEDALLHGGSSEVNVNYGANEQFAGNAWTSGGSPLVIRSVIEFDLTSIPASSTITSAELSLYARDNTAGLGQHSTLSGPNNCWLERVDSPWDESTVTWNTQPTSTSLNRVNIPASTSPTQDYPNIDVAALVQDMIDNPSSSHGFMLKLQDETAYRNLNFCSSDHSNPALRPKLMVCYSSLVTAIDEPSKENQASVSVYPNPAKDKLSVELTNADLSKSIKLILINSLGQVTKEVSINTSISTVELTSISSGIYFYQLKSDQNLLKSGKIIIH